jgi:hypothetical protein
MMRMTDLESLEFVAKHAPIPMGFDVRSVKEREFQAAAKIRGIQEKCRRCANACPVLKGSPGTRGKFTCYSFTEKRRKV